MSTPDNAVNEDVLKEAFEALKKIFPDAKPIELEDTKEQIAAKKPPMWCVMSCKYVDTTLVATIHACFFSEPEAIKARDWMEKNSPLDKAIGWYEIEPTKLSSMK
jgi:hypothetical protein